MPLNVGGHVCLLFSLVWGVGCLAVVYLVQPLVLKLLAPLPVPVGWVLLALFGATALADLILTAIEAAKIPKRLQALEEMERGLRRISDGIGAGLSGRTLELWEKGQEKFSTQKWDELLGTLGSRKQEFLADPKFLKYKGFKVADISDCGINLMYLPLAENADQPRFKDCARHPKVGEMGFVLYYTDQCPFTYYWVPKVQEAAKEHGISFQAFHITDKEAAQNVPAPVTTYALFRDGEFLTQGIQSDKKFLALAGIK